MPCTGRGRVSALCPWPGGSCSKSMHTGFSLLFNFLLQCCLLRAAFLPTQTKEAPKWLSSLYHTICFTVFISTCHCLMHVFAGLFTVNLPLTGYKLQGVLAQSFISSPQNKCLVHYRYTISIYWLMEWINKWTWKNTLGACISKHYYSKYFQKVFPVRDRAKTDTINMPPAW